MQKIQHTRVVRIISIVVVLFLMVMAQPVFAAQLSFSTPTKTVGTEQMFKVNLLLDTEGKSINALSGTITFSNSATVLSDIYDANSILPLWVIAPHATSKGIVFAGVIPGGYSGSNGLVLTLVLHGVDIGTSSVTLQSVHAFLNDGTGSSVPVSVTPLSVSVNTHSHTSIPIPQDITSPEPFAPHVARTPSVFNGRWFISFSTTDKGTSVARYEVKEVPITILAPFYAWAPVTSPHVLTDQRLTSYVYIRAIDKAGNSRIERINPPYSMLWYGNGFILVVLLLIGGAYILVYKIWKYAQ